MIFIFRNKRLQSNRKENPVQDRMAIKIVQKCIKVQERCAHYLLIKSERLSHMSKISLLLLFCLSTGGYSMYMIVRSFITTESRAFTITKIKSPAHVRDEDEENLRTTNVISLEEFQQIERFQDFMDSLSETESGRKIIDSILLYRPGLIDSIRQIENIYQSQSSKK